MQSRLEHIRHIPHFYLIRMVESRLLSFFLKDAAEPFLDLGCGDGEFARSLGLNQLYGIDIDTAALNRLVRDGYYENTHIAKASEIPYADHFFGTVFSNCAVEHMDDLLLVLKEVNRILKSQGQFIFTVPKPEFFSIVKADSLLVSLGLADDDAIENYNQIHHHRNILGLEEWRELLRKEGFVLKKYVAYLPGAFGRFVARMDMLYTLQNSATKQMISSLENRYFSPSGAFFRWRVKRYLQNPMTASTGTHIVIVAQKNA